VIFSSNIIKTPESSRDRAYIKKREGKRKAPRVSSNKMVSQHFERRKILQLQKILFDVIPFSPPPSYQFKTPFQNH
jgi:hypothetical protein